MAGTCPELTRSDSRHPLAHSAPCPARRRCASPFSPTRGGPGSGRRASSQATEQWPDPIYTAAIACQNDQSVPTRPARSMARHRIGHGCRQDRPRCGPHGPAHRAASRAWLCWPMAALVGHDDRRQFPPFDAISRIDRRGGRPGRAGPSSFSTRRAFVLSPGQPLFCGPIKLPAIDIEAEFRSLPPLEMGLFTAAHAGRTREPPKDSADH